MLLIIQHITVHWTPKSRGGDQARRRNSVPEAFSLPLSGSPSVPFLHTISVGESSGFDSPTEEVSPLGAGPIYHIGSAEVRPDGDDAVFLYNPTAKLTGAPTRPQFPRQVGRFSRGQWARLVYNGRFAEETGWRYQKVIINSGLFDRPSADSFLAAAPSQELRDLTKLF